MICKKQIDDMASKMVSSTNEVMTLVVPGAQAYQNFAEALGAFEWGGHSLRTAWSQRVALSQTFRKVLNNEIRPIESGDAVHNWGFNAEIPREIRNSPDFKGALSHLSVLWSETTSPWENNEAMNALIAILSIEGIGIARVSKWICFINQELYAIYDSRVAYALLGLTIANRRVFPFVGGRSAPNGRPARVTQSAAISDPEKTATVYVNFLRLVRAIAAKLNELQPLSEDLQSMVGVSWTPALVEMALFMYGKDRTKQAGIVRLTRRFNRPWGSQPCFATA